MKSNFFHKISLMPVFFALLIGCNRSSTKSTPEPPKPQDCQQVYEQLSTTEFHSLQEALDATSNFLTEFDDQCPVYANVRSLQTKFNEMNQLFLDIDNGTAPKQRYCDFISKVKTDGNMYKSSDIEAVRSTWNYVVNEKKQEYMRQRLESIDDEEFMPRLKNYVLDEVKRWYPKFRVEEGYVLNERMEDMSVVEEGGKLAMRGACIVHVEMKGDRNKLGEKWFPRIDERYRKVGYVEVWAEGTMRLSDSNCDVKFSRGHLEISLDNMPEKPNIHIEFHVF